MKIHFSEPKPFRCSAQSKFSKTLEEAIEHSCCWYDRPLLVFTAQRNVSSRIGGREGLSRRSLSPFSLTVLSRCSLSLFSLTVMYLIGRMARLARSPFILAFNGLRFERFSRTHFELTGKQTNRSIYFFILEINQTALCLVCGYTALDWSRIKSVVLKANILVVLQHSSGVHKKCSEQNLLRCSVAIRQGDDNTLKVCSGSNALKCRILGRLGRRAGKSKIGDSRISLEKKSLWRSLLVKKATNHDLWSQVLEPIDTLKHPAQSEYRSLVSWKTKGIS